MARLVGLVMTLFGSISLPHVNQMTGSRGYVWSRGKLIVSLGLAMWVVGEAALVGLLGVKTN